MTVSQSLIKTSGRFSLIACFIICIVFISFRFIPEKYKNDEPFRVTTWDALGYYLYLPSVFIYEDFKELNWYPAIENKYKVQGGSFYQAMKADNGSYAFRYLAGVAVMELPFFLAAHAFAHVFDYPPDGFSAPYQFAIAFGALIYFCLSLFLLRKVLLRFFDDRVTAIALQLLTLASNLIQYVSIEGAMSHAYIFPLYVLMLYFTIKWHDNPSLTVAAIIGAIAGLAMISRPTELLIIFIPLLWSMSTKKERTAKWQIIVNYKNQILLAAVMLFIAMSPQLIYWKLATGHFIFDVGSKWVFLNPNFRVLFGWEVGWFVYTPVTILFVMGLFFMKPYAFKLPALVFCLLNIYVIIAWFEWKYGATYSCRALVQSYPVFALPLAALIERIKGRWKYIFYVLVLYLICVNLFQIRQYNQTIIHSRDMNKNYYSRIYLNPDPDAFDMSLLDSNEIPQNEHNYLSKTIYLMEAKRNVNIPENSEFVLWQSNFKRDNSQPGLQWLRIKCTMALHYSGWGSFLHASIVMNDSIIDKKVRLLNGIAEPRKQNDYAFYMKVPPGYYNANLKLYLHSGSPLDGEIKRIHVESLHSEFGNHED